MEVLLLRHGQTAMNGEGRYLGRTDLPLCPEGAAALQAGGTAPQVKTVYVSPLRRAVETASICFPQARQILVPDLREMDFGVFEGRSYREMEHDPAYRKWVDEQCRTPCPGGEGMVGFVDRVCAAFQATVAGCLAVGEPQLIVVAHGGTIMALLSRWGRPRRDYYDWSVPNGQGYLLRLEEASWEADPALTTPRLLPSLLAWREET